jgi:hypothetical protein
VNQPLLATTIVTAQEEMAKHCVNYPKSDDVGAFSASYFLVPLETT